MIAVRFARLYAASLLLGCLLLTAGESEARSFRVNQIPNGNAVPNTSNNACLTCHNGGGGGPRNAFGLAVQALVSPGANTPFWSPALAAEDSDGDGASNGLELQDPNGAWQPGQPAPGVASLVTHPGNASSKPAAQATPTPMIEPTPTPTVAPEPTLAPTPTQGPVVTSPGEAYVAVLSGEQEVPPVQTDGSGVAVLRLHEPENVLQYWIVVSDLENVTNSHIHLGAVGVSGGVKYPVNVPTTGYSEGSISISAEDIANLENGLLYVNVHTAQNTAGEIRGQIMAEPIRFTAALTGDQEVPPVTTQASGEASVTLSDDLKTLSYTLTVQDITGVTMAHIHQGAVGVSGGVVFPIASAPFTAESGDITLTEDQLETLLKGEYYFNVHTTQNTGGEIRGQILFDGSEQTAVSAWSLF